MSSSSTTVASTSKKRDLFTPPATTEMVSCAGFRVLPVRLLRGAEDEEDEEEEEEVHVGEDETRNNNSGGARKRRRFHELLLRPLSADDELPKALRAAAKGTVGRALLVSNVPNDYDRTALSELLGAAGVLESVELASATDACGEAMQLAVCVFRRAESLREACAMRVEQPFADAVARERAGLPGAPATWVAAFHAERPKDLRAWQKQCDAVVAEYDERVAEEEREKEALASTMDSDGFTVVTYRKKKKGKQTSGGTTVTAVKAGTANVSFHRKKKERKKRLLQDFYAFQARAKKENELKALKRKFEEDKARLARIRTERKFNPHK